MYANNGSSLGGELLWPANSPYMYIKPKQLAPKTASVSFDLAWPSGKQVDTVGNSCVANRTCIYCEWNPRRETVEAIDNL
jgi:hypothetical protein